MLSLPVRMLSHKVLSPMTEALSEALAVRLLNESDSLRRLQQSKHVLCATDFSRTTGPDGRSYVTTGLLLTTPEAYRTWITGPRDRFRSADSFGRQKISYKEIRARSDHEARLGSFLAAAGKLEGILLTISVHDIAGGVFTRRTDSQTHANLELFRDWPPHVFESLVRTANLLMASCAPVLTKGQTLCWICDDDEIFANDDIGRATLGFVEGFMEGVVCDGVTVASITPSSKYLIDSLKAEDILAISDVAAGAMGDLQVESDARYGFPPLEEWVGAPSRKVKSQLVTGWFADPGPQLVRIALALDSKENMAKTIFFGNRLQEVTA